MQRIFNTLILAALGFTLAACEQDMNSSNLKNQPMGAKVTTDAHPAFVYSISEQVFERGNWVNYYSVSVSDSDGTDAAKIYTAASTSVSDVSATWSATGTSVSFIEKPSGDGWGAYAIKAVDVSVSRGTASGSNTRTIYSTSTSDSLKILGQAWCHASGVNKIAFIGRTPNEWGIYTVSTSGGSPTKIYSLSTSNGNFDNSYAITWSNDGTKLAFVEVSSTPSYSIKVISSSGSVSATLESGTYQEIDWLQWSNSGKNEIAFSAVKTGVTPGYGHFLGRDLYTIGTTSGSAATLLVAGQTQYEGGKSMLSPYWSPNNSELIYTQFGVTYTVTDSSVTSVAGSVQFKVVVGTGTATNIGQLKYGDWKTP